MKSLENKILDKVYAYEARKTMLQVIFDVVGIVFFAFITLIFGWVIIDILIEQETFELFQIFNENIEVVGKYLGDIIQEFYLEIPKSIALVFGVGLTILVYLIFHTIRNSSKIINKVRSIVKFWHH